MNDRTPKALLPAGMQDGLPPQATAEADVNARLVTHFGAWGYGRVKPPLMEFEENLLSGSGRAMAEHAFRVQDPVSQRMLALRPDMTLQVARIAHSRLSNAPRPLRLAYSGQVVRVKGSQLRPARQLGQVGAELIGASSPAADVEVILMSVDALAACGIEGLSVDLGLPTLAASVTESADLDTDRALELRTALNRKDGAGIDALADVLGDEATRTLGVMLEAVGEARSGLAKLQSLNLPEDAARQLTHLAQVANGILEARPDVRLTVDPVENRGFEYHTGVTFALFARGVKGELGRGGRYEAGSSDKIEIATGVTLFMNTVMQALPEETERTSVFLPWGTPGGDALNLRAEGWCTVAALDETPDADTEARRLNCTHVYLDNAVRELK